MTSNIVLHVYALCFNENHILPRFFNHYKCADKIIVYDNYSTDNSKQIIDSYPSGQVEHRYFDTHGTFDDIFHKNLKDMIWKESVGIADYVIVQDLDEFVFFPKYPYDLKAGINDLKIHNIHHINCIGYEMCCDENTYNNMPPNATIVDYLHNGSPNTGYNKPLLFNPNSVKATHFSAGQHLWWPELIIQNGSDYHLDVLLLHYRHLGIQWEYERRLAIKPRMKPNNQGMGIEYFMPDEKIREYVSEFYKKSFDLSSIMFPTIRRITCVIWGGLCNQLFVISATLALAKKYGFQPFFQKSNSRICHNMNGYWDTMLRQLPYDQCNTDNFVTINENMNQSYEEIKVPDGSANILLKGYYQTDKYFEEYKSEIRDIFSLCEKDRNHVTQYVQNLKNKFVGQKLVGVHIRRGDYLKLNWCLPKSYYTDSFNKIQNIMGEIPQYIIFSDDVAWCHDNFKDLHVCEEPIDYIQMAIMGSLDGYIISNSTFAWWSVFLGDVTEQRPVISPNPWFKNTPYNPYIIRSNWISQGV